MLFVSPFAHIDNDFQTAIFGNFCCLKPQFERFFALIILPPATIIAQKTPIVNMGEQVIPFFERMFHILKNGNLRGRSPRPPTPENFRRPLNFQALNFCCTSRKNLKNFYPS